MIKRKDQKQRAKTRRNTPQFLRTGHCPCSPDVGDCPRCHVQSKKLTRKTRKQQS